MLYLCRQASNRVNVICLGVNIYNIIMLESSKLKVWFTWNCSGGLLLKSKQHQHWQTSGDSLQAVLLNSAISALTNYSPCLTIPTTKQNVFPDCLADSAVTRWILQVFIQWVHLLGFFQCLTHFTISPNNLQPSIFASEVF